MTYRALLIGNSTFEADGGLNALNAPTKDVARLHGALVDPDSGLFREEFVRLVTERKHDEILDELDEFFASGGRDDLMLLYYSGHGVLDEFNNLYLCGRDTRSDRLARTGISDGTINDFIRGAASRRTVLVLDCCSSGMFKGGAIGTQLGGPGRFIISSARGKTLANDAQSPTGTSLFTEHLVEGLLGGAPDVNNDGLIDLHEIYDFVKKRLADTSKQVPNIRFEGDGDISLARCRQAPAIAVAVDSSGVPPRHSAERAFGLSESVITLRDVDPDERLHPEVVEICRFTDDDLDITAESLDDWLQADVKGDRVVVRLNPREGNNRGKILVRDQLSGGVQTLRVEAFVRTRRPAQSPPDAGLAHTKSAQSPGSTAARATAQTAPSPPSGPPVPHNRPPQNPPPQNPPPRYLPPQNPPPRYLPPQNPPPQNPPPRYPLPQGGPYYAPQPPSGSAPVYQHEPRPAAPGNNGLAIASLVLGLLWIYWIGSVLAIIFGYVAKKQIARTGQPGKGMATAGVVLGWLGMAFLAIAIIYLSTQSTSLATLNQALPELGAARTRRCPNQALPEPGAA